MMEIPEYVTEQWLRTEGAERFHQKTAFWAARMKVSYGRITIRDQKTRWGSCSSRGNLNFNWRLLLMPERVMDYVIVHELAHRREMNHSAAFWQIVETYLPDYRERRQWLKENGLSGHRLFLRDLRKHNSGKHQQTAEEFFRRQILMQDNPSG